MDGQRFDHVTRLIGAGATRRSVVKGLTGALIGAAGLAGLRSQAGATVTCGDLLAPCGGQNDPPCCSGICGKGICITENGCFSDEDCGDGEICCGVDAGFGVCDAIECCGVGDQVHCGEGLVCNEEGFCDVPCLGFEEPCGAGGPAQGEIPCCDGLSCIDGSCQPICANEGEACGILDGLKVFCCEGLACNSESVCEEIIVLECAVDSDCVAADAGDVDAAICCGGFCITGIECCIDDEDPNARCPEGSSCFEGVCVFACKGDADCDSGTCCCPDGSCSDDCCEEVPPPESGGVTALPTTGVGGGNGGGTALLGAALAAGAAAYLAGKKPKGGEEEA
jgi:hypothetical protein